MEITAKAARINRGITRKEAAEHLGISKSSYANYENGVYSPSLDTAKQIAELVEWPFDEIVFAPKI